ncbi:hypothetical protein ACQ5SK_41660 [Bradyrhizobium japonicum]
MGALSAEAVIRDYESAAKEIEAMGAELIDAARKCEALTAQVHDAIAFMRETAAGYRDEGRKIFKRIEECALFTEDVRKTCEEVKRRMKDVSVGESCNEELATEEPSRPGSCQCTRYGEAGVERSSQDGRALVRPHPAGWASKPIAYGRETSPFARVPDVI